MLAILKHIQQSSSVWDCVICACRQLRFLHAGPMGDIEDVVWSHAPGPPMLANASSFWEEERGDGDIEFGRLQVRSPFPIYLENSSKIGLKKRA